MGHGMSLKRYLLLCLLMLFTAAQGQPKLPTNVILITIDTLRADHTGP